MNVLPFTYNNSNRKFKSMPSAPANDATEVDYPRWKVQVVYHRDRFFTETKTYYVEEIEDVHDIIEAGPDFHAVCRVIITLSSPYGPNKTTLSDIERREKGGWE